MEEILAFLKENKPYYLATSDGDQARVRAMGTIHIFEGDLYFQTGRNKKMYSQLKANPKVEICAYDGKRWLRITACAHEDKRIEAVESLLDGYPRLRERYTPGDGITTVFRLDIGSAYFDSNSSEPKRIIMSS